MFTKSYLNFLVFNILLISFTVNSSEINYEGSIYGKLHISLEDYKTNTSHETDFKNNASRLGIKGSWKLSESLNLSFQVEKEIDPTDGRADKGKVFKDRNTFIALNGSFGKIFTGTHDTAFKQAQLKVDLFNDTRSDIKYLLHGENRMNSFIGYTSPEIIKGLTVTFNSISQSNDSYKSSSIYYSIGKIQTSLAFDRKAKGYDSQRLAIMIPIDDYNIGLLYQSSKDLSSNISNSGSVFSLKRKISEKGNILFQSTKSDMKINAGEQKSIGYSHRIKQNIKTFIHYSKMSKDINLKDTSSTSLGFEYKF